MVVCAYGGERARLGDCDHSDRRHRSDRPPGPRRQQLIPHIAQPCCAPQRSTMSPAPSLCGWEERRAAQRQNSLIEVRAVGSSMLMTVDDSPAHTQPIRLLGRGQGTGAMNNNVNFTRTYPRGHSASQSSLITPGTTLPYTQQNRAVNDSCTTATRPCSFIPCGPAYVFSTEHQLWHHVCHTPSGDRIHLRTSVPESTQTQAGLHPDIRNHAQACF